MLTTQRYSDAACYFVVQHNRDHFIQLAQVSMTKTAPLGIALGFVTPACTPRVAGFWQAQTQQHNRDAPKPQPYGLYKQSVHNPVA